MLGLLTLISTQHQAHPTAGQPPGQEPAKQIAAPRVPVDGLHSQPETGDSPFWSSGDGPTGHRPPARKHGAFTTLTAMTTDSAPRPSVLGTALHAWTDRGPRMPVDQTPGPVRASNADALPGLTAARMLTPAQIMPRSSTGSRVAQVWVTGYSLLGITATGATSGPGICAVDPSFIPLGTHITIDGLGACIAADTGPAVVGAHIDVWVPSADQAYGLTGWYTVHW
jgi:3D (Asp-Asp-Asp) domain-containing protein